MRKFFVLVLAATLALTMTAGVAQAKGKGTGKGPKPDKLVTYNFEGTIASVDGATSTVVVNVEEANKAARSSLGEQVIGQQVSFAVTAETKVEVHGAEATFAELEAGDLVAVQSKAPEGATSFSARVIDAQSPPADPTAV